MRTPAVKGRSEECGWHIMVHTLPVRRRQSVEMNRTSFGCCPTTPSILCGCILSTCAESPSLVRLLFPRAATEQHFERDTPCNLNEVLLRLVPA